MSETMLLVQVSPKVFNIDEDMELEGKGMAIGDMSQKDFIDPTKNPLLAEIFKQYEIFDADRIFGTIKIPKKNVSINDRKDLIFFYDKLYHFAVALSEDEYTIVGEI